MPIKPDAELRISSRVTPKNLSIEKCGNGYLLSCPDIGALSLFDKVEAVLFPLLWQSAEPEISMIDFLVETGHDSEQAGNKVGAFLAKIEGNGWCRDELKASDPTPLIAVYLTVTLKCNMSCRYCYQKFNERRHADMEKSTFLNIVEQVTAINPNCEFIITGGEPFVVKDIFWYLDQISEHEASFSILTNGSLITEEIAKRLSTYSNLSKVQVSIDGVTEEVNSITRGKSNLARTMAGINAIAGQNISLTLAPTIHKRNINEFEDIARLAISVGANLSPNNLRVSDDPLSDLYLEPMEAYEVLKNMNRRLADQQLSTIDKQKPEAERDLKTTQEDSSQPGEIPLVCGMARSIVNFDSNGDIYPCHLLAVEEMKMGNIETESLSSVLDSERTKRMRVVSTNIGKCKNCKFVASCAGGCRAGAYHSYGGVDREDSICSVLHKSHMDSLLMKGNTA